MGAGKVIAYLDSNVFIYAALDAGERGNHAGYILNGVQDSKITAVTSALTFDEVVFAVQKHKGADAALKAGEAFLHMGNLIILDVSRYTLSEAFGAMKEFSLAPRDAIHYATMKINKIHELVSEDSHFDRVRPLRRYGLKRFREMIK